MTDRCERCDLLADELNAARRRSIKPIVCGQNDAGVTFEEAGGCGQPITSVEQLYRCADCGVPFHRQCIKLHFGREA
jgi:hypothetical protein